MIAPDAAGQVLIIVAVLIALLAIYNLFFAPLKKVRPRVQPVRHDGSAGDVEMAKAMAIDAAKKELGPAIRVIRENS